MSDLIHTWHILRSGKWQDRREVTGIEKLWLEARDQSGPGVCVQYREWDDDPDGMANLIWRNSPPDVTINDYDYSYGGGWGFTQFARALLRRGLRIATAVMCDPVYCPPLAIMRWRSLVNRGPLAPKIVIPRNVDRIVWFRQKQDKPQGHSIICEGPTKVLGPYWLDAGHSYMDEQKEFHDAALHVIRGEQGPLQA